VGTESINISFTTTGPLATGTVTLDSGVAGSVDGILVDSVEIMSGAEAFTVDLPTTAAAVAANINANTSSPDYNAVAVGTVITITSVDAGSAVNGFTVVSSVTTIVSTDVAMAGGAGAVQTTGATAISAGGAEQAAGTMAAAVAALLDVQVVQKGSRIEITPLAPSTGVTIDTVAIT
jgi:hypothetical protein